MIKFKNKPHLATSNAGLEIKNIRKSISKKPIVRDVSLKVERGKATGLLGQNGAGKTTSFLLCLGLLNPDGGKILLDNGVVKESTVLNSPTKGLLVEGLVWREMSQFSPNCVLLVIASEHFDETDYIRDYEDFKRMVNS